MRLQLLLLLTAVAVASLAAGPAVAAKDPRLAYLERTLKADMVKTFKHRAPKLTLTTVTCKLPADGVTSHCKASFTVGSVKGYYPVTAKLRDVGGALAWTAASPQCWDAAKKKYAPC